MALRKVPGALALGLLASMASHAVVFGNEHVMGGAFHAVLIQIALVASACLLVFFGALAVGQTRSAADGSIVAGRLRARLPGIVPTLTCGALWFAGIEAIEPHHEGAAPAATLCALVALSWIVLRLAGAVVKILAAAVFAVARTRFAPRAAAAVRASHTPLPLRRTHPAHRRFARPPPIAV